MNRELAWEEAEQYMDGTWVKNVDGKAKKVLALDNANHRLFLWGDIKGDTLNADIVSERGLVFLCHYCHRWMPIRKLVRHKWPTVVICEGSDRRLQLAQDEVLDDIVNGRLSPLDDGLN